MLLYAANETNQRIDSFSVDDKDDKQDMRILNELENIDDDLEKEGIIIVRIDNDAEAKEYGIDHLPTLIYFEDKIPAIYEGDLLNEDEVLEWLIQQKNSATIEEVTDEILTDLIEDHEYVVVYFSEHFLISFNELLIKLKSITIIFSAMFDISN